MENSNNTSDFTTKNHINLNVNVQLDEKAIKDLLDKVREIVEKQYPDVYRDFHYMPKKFNDFSYIPKQKCNFDGLAPGIYLLSCNCPRCSTWC